MEDVGLVRFWLIYIHERQDNTDWPVLCAHNQHKQQHTARDVELHYMYA